MAQIDKNVKLYKKIQVQTEIKSVQVPHCKH